MAVTPIIATGGLRKLQRDLKVMAPDAAVEVRSLIKDQMQPMLAIAQSNAPGTGASIGGRWRATVRGSNGALTNSHPGVRVNEFGGIIRPNNGPIVFEPSHMIYGPGGAIEKGKQGVERGLMVGFERLSRRHGF